MRYILMSQMLILALALASCGDDRAAPAARTQAATIAQPREAPVLADFQRNGGLAATLDKLVVRRDGSATLDKRYGGAGRRMSKFRLSDAMLVRVRRALRRLPRRLLDAGTPTPQGATFLLSYGGRTYAAKEGAIGAVGRPAFEALNAVVDGAGRAR